MELKVEEIKKINLNKGDVLAVRAPNGTTRSALHTLQKCFADAFPNNKIAVYAGELEFTKLGPEEVKNG